MLQIFQRIRRRLYLWGNKLSIISFYSCLLFSMASATLSAGYIAIKFQSLTQTDLSPFQFFLNLILYSFIVAGAVILIAGVFKVLLLIVGWICKKVGLPDRLKLVPINYKKQVELRIDNLEEEEFTGELKIIKIGKEKLDTPLTMAVIKGRKRDPLLILPKDESISIFIAHFDNELGAAFFVDAYKQKKWINPFASSFQVKLLGQLENGTKINKESKWYISYTMGDDENINGITISKPLELKLVIKM